VSLPPCRLSGPGLVVGRGLGDEMDFNDSISLCEVRGGAFNKQPCENQISTQETLSTETLRRGRSRKRRG
jgi:hypothetical protein